MNQMATPMPPITTAAIATAYSSDNRISRSRLNAQNRDASPAGRSWSMMPSGVSASTIVSRTSPVTEQPQRSELDDHRIGDPVVQALLRLAENKQVVHQVVETADHWNQRGQPVHDIPHPEDSPERCPRPVFPHDFDTHQPLGDRLPVALHENDGDPGPRDEADQRGDHPCSEDHPCSGENLGVQCSAAAERLD